MNFMEYNQVEGVIIRDAAIGELEGLVEVYRAVFPVHNIFQRSEGEILKYLKDMHQENSNFGGGFIIAVMDGLAIGGILVKKESQDLEGEHFIWKFNHVGVHPEHQGKGIGRELMEAAETKIRNMIKEGKIKTAKIELGVAEGEKDSIKFYEKFDFEVEGELKSHYRAGEKAYILGKEILE